jgi:hypothetical protein
MPATGATPYSSVTAYATGADMVANRDWRALADFLTDPSDSTTNPTRPTTQAAVLTIFTTQDAIGYRALRWASAQIEAAVTAGQRYQPEDLLVMTQQQIIPTAQGGDGVLTGYMVGRDLLVGLACDLAFWWLVKRRKSGIRPEEVSGVWDALDMLDRLKGGERIFPFQETQLAGLPETSALDDYTDVTQAAVPVSVTASRLFGQRNGRIGY